jgi:hypothetical protein
MTPAARARLVIGFSPCRSDLYRVPGDGAGAVVRRPSGLHHLCFAATTFARDALAVDASWGDSAAEQPPDARRVRSSSRAFEA